MKPCWAEAMRRPALAVLAAVSLSTCAGIGAPPAAERPNAAPNAVQVSQQQGGRFIVLAGPKRRHAEPYLGIASTNFDLLRSFIDTRNGGIAHQLYVQDSYGGPTRNWNAARLATGQSLRFLPITVSEVTCENGCSYAEEFAAALPEPLLRASPQGLAVVFTSRSGNEKTIVVPPDLIAQQLAAVAEARAARPAAVAAPTPAPAAVRADYCFALACIKTGRRPIHIIAPPSGTLASATSCAPILPAASAFFSCRAFDGAEAMLRTMIATPARFSRAFGAARRI